MKRFVFSLESLLKYKGTVERKQQADLSMAQAVLNRLLELLARMDAQFARNAEEMERLLNEQSSAQKLEQYSNYMRHLTQDRHALLARIAEAEEEVHRCQEALIATIKELKTLGNLKDEQYLRYLEEVRAEEAKEINDLVSYQTITAVDR